MDNATENILSQLWEHVEKEKTTSKIAQRIYNYLNEDNLNAIILDRSVFWLEKTSSSSTIPNTVYTYIKQWGINQGYQYLYDLK